MSVVCSGTTLVGKACTRKVKSPGILCHNHKPKQSPDIIKMLSNQQVNIKSDQIKVKLDDCSICLCEVEENEDCGLKCGHSHHIDCVKGLIKLQCPICREFLKDLNWIPLLLIV